MQQLNLNFFDHQLLLFSLQNLFASQFESPTYVCWDAGRPKNEGGIHDDRYFHGGIRDKNISVGTGLAHFDRGDAG